MDLAALRTQQQQLAASVERADRLDRDPPALIGGADVGFEQEGEINRRGNRDGICYRVVSPDCLCHCGNDLHSLHRVQPTRTQPSLQNFKPN